ncbi:MAG: hypothetical protein IKP73_14655 [Bacteroidales bacterium]|nr:hypothetical protein [Bacteroidales bacterium]
MVLFTAILQIYVEKGFLYKIGTAEQSLLTPSLLILTTYSTLNLKKIPIPLQKKWLYLVGCYCVSFILLLLFPSDAWVATGGDITWDAIMFKNVAPAHPTVNKMATLLFIMPTLVYLYIYINWKYIDYKKLLSKLSLISNYFIILGVIEFFTKNVLMLNDIWGDVSLAFWGDTSSTIHAGRLRGLFYESCLFTREASHYVYSLLCVAIIKLADNIMNNRNKIIDFWIVICLILMLLSTSFASLNMITAFFCIYFAYRWGVRHLTEKKAEILMTGTFVVMLLLVTSVSSILNIGEGSFIGDRLQNAFDNFGNYMTFDIANGNNIDTYGDGSTYIRTLSVFQTLKVFFDRPFFGYSLGTMFCHGSTPTFLAHVGVLGLICWLNFYLLKCPLKKSLMVCPIPYYIGVIVLLACNFFNSVATSISFYYFMMPLLFSITYCFIFQKNEGKRNNNLL